MIKHIVFFRFHDTGQKESVLHEVKARLESLHTGIPEIVHLEAGINFSDRTSAYDMALISDFRSVEELDRYRNHADHLALVDYIHQFEVETAVVDYRY